MRPDHPKPDKNDLSFTSAAEDTGQIELMDSKRQSRSPNPESNRKKPLMKMNTTAGSSKKTRLKSSRELRIKA